MNEEQIFAHADVAKPETRAERLAKCNQCSSFHSDEGRCKECGCIMWIKVSVPFASCPKGEW